jgi:transcriptional regulator of acetoin/glycerol metabolism
MMESEDLDRTREAWRIYVQTGRIARELLRERTQLSWVRCATLQTNPHTLAARKLSDVETPGLTRRHAALIRSARPYLRALSVAVGGQQHAALLSDADGIVLDMQSDEKTTEAANAGTFPSPCVLMSEAAAGSNGIGTALADKDYVEVVGPEHFVEVLGSYTCQGVPLRGPDRHVVGVLAMTVRSFQTAERVREILFSGAVGIEAELVRQHIEEVVRAFVDSAAGPIGGDELRQDLVQLQAAARLRVDAAAETTRQRGPREAFNLIRTADELTRRFHRQAELWGQIVGEQEGTLRLVDLNETLTNMIELFETEATLRDVRFVLGAKTRALAYLDPRTAGRLLFRAFVKELCVAPRGTAIGIEARYARGEAEAMVIFSTGQTVLLPGPSLDKHPSELRLP